MTGTIEINGETYEVDKITVSTVAETDADDRPSFDTFVREETELWVGGTIFMTPPWDESEVPTVGGSFLTSSDLLLESKGNHFDGDEVRSLVDTEGVWVRSVFCSGDTQYIALKDSRDEE